MESKFAINLVITLAYGGVYWWPLVSKLAIEHGVTLVLWWCQLVVMYA
jgi:hypothetical protein